MEFSIVANPTLIPIAFAANGLKNVIQKTRQPAQDAQDMTWSDGSPLITLTPIEDGGKAPKGQDFNGVLNTITEHNIFVQNGNRFKWDPNIAIEFNGYNKDAIVQSQDGLREYISLIPNNTTNPESSTTGTWAIYSGNGSIPVATSTVAGIMTVINNLTSTNVGSALSAAMGRALNEAINLKLSIANAFGIGQSNYDMTSSRSKGILYSNDTNKPIEVRVVVNGGVSSTGNTIYVNGSLAFLFSVHTNMTAPFTFTVPPSHTYIVNTTSTINSWSELR